MRNNVAAPLAVFLLLLTVLGFTVSAAQEKPVAKSEQILPVTTPVMTMSVAPEDNKSFGVKPLPTPIVVEEKEKREEPKTAAISTKKEETKRVAVKEKVSKKKKIQVAMVIPERPKKVVARGTSSETGDVIRLALSFRGVPYRHGGSSGRGFDCSGFTSYVYRNAAGISLPRTSGGQSDIGSAVLKSDLKQGDIVYFNTNGHNVSHVGIYIGGNSFVHASCSKGITVTSLSDSYYAPRYLGARRVK
jgi:cell wall-associated NlpC family hydrolase